MHSNKTNQPVSVVPETLQAEGFLINFVNKNPYAVVIKIKKDNSIRRKYKTARCRNIDIIAVLSSGKTGL